MRAKVLVVGRSFATGIERHAKGGLPVVATKVVQVLCRQAEWLDPEIKDLRKARPEPTFKNITRLAVAHGRLTAALSSVTRESNAPRSFASKYLHFHAPVFPIFDGIAFRHLKSRSVMPWNRAWYETFPKPKQADEIYWGYCVRIAQMAASWRASGLEPLSRQLDVYLMSEAAAVRAKLRGD